MNDFIATAFSHKKKTFVEAVMDVVLIHEKIREAGLVVVDGRKLQKYFEETLPKIGMAFVKLSSHGVYFVFLATGKSSTRIREIAEHHKRCFGATDEWSLDRQEKCGKLSGPGGAWYDAGVVFGYLHPNTGEIKTNGGLRFVVWINDTSIQVMGPQSVDLKDPILFQYAMDRCEKVKRVLKKLFAKDHVDCVAEFSHH